VPHVPQDVLDRLAALEREVRQLRGRAQIRPALTEILAGTVRIGEGGELIVQAPGGVRHLLVGHLGTTYGEREYGVLIRRRDGTEAVSVWNGVNPTEPQALRIKDAQGNDLLTEDVKAGGLYRPWVPLPDLADDRIATWPTTTSGSFTTLEQGNAFLQHPRIAALVSLSGTGQVRLLVDDQVIATATNGNIDGTYAVPGYDFGDRVNIKIQARTTSAGDPVYARTRYLYGVGSA